MRYTLCVLAAAVPVLAGVGEPDTDGDGLADFQEVHKHFTDPSRVDSDGDGAPDGAWLERREFTYTVRAVIQLLPPFSLDAMNDDYQDARLLDERPGCAEIEVVLYPLNTCQDDIGADANWRTPEDAVAPYLAPGPTNNFDEALRREVLGELGAAGIDPGTLTDRDAARSVSSWLMKRSAYEDSFTTFAVELAGGELRVAPDAQHVVDQTLGERGRTLQEQWDRELLGAGMFRTRIHGSCTSSSIYLSTGLRAVGIPTRTIVCIPVIDASDPEEGRLAAGLESHVVRGAVQKAARQMGNSWASHTFNEVYVGGRWRRLNYDRLGQPILDGGLLGLMVHIHTVADWAEAGMVTWGRRAGGDHDDVFGHSNPYSCVSLSDRFGAHCSLGNPEPEERHDRLTISRVYWYSQAGPDGVRMRLDDAETAGHLLVHVDERAAGEGVDQYGNFYAAVGKDFTLRAEGQADVRAAATRGYWVDESKALRDFYVQIPAEEYPKMVPGVAYRLVPADTEAPFAWAVAPGLTVVRPAEGGAEGPGAPGVEFRTLSVAQWAESADAPEWMREVFEEDGTGHIIAHVAEWDAGGFESIRRFTDMADGQFTLESEGEPPVVGRCASGGISKEDGTFREVVIQFERAEIDKVKRGAVYVLRPRNGTPGWEWRVDAAMEVVLR